MKFQTDKKGFTLVEMMVSVSLFVIVATIVSVAFVSLANIYRKVQSNRAVIDSVNFMMDTLSYELREGRNWRVYQSDSCVNAVGGCYTAITFTRYNGPDDPDGEEVTYKFNKDVNPPSVVQCIGPCGSVQNNLNSNEVTINKFNIYVDTAKAVPKATILIEGTARSSAKIFTDFALQTSLSQRNP